MWHDPAILGACALIALLIAIPTVEAARRRRISRELAEVAGGLIDFAGAVRREQRRLPLDEALQARARGLRIPEWLSFEYLQALAAPDPELLAQSAQRLGLRLKRRVAFERKMLARTASGRWRGAFAAAAPAVVLLALAVGGVAVPALTLVWLLLLESLGCWLLWRAARVEV